MKSLILCSLLLLIAFYGKCQNDLNSMFLDVQESVKMVSTSHDFHFIHVDSEIANKDGKKIGYGFTEYYWIGDTLLKISNAYNYRFRKNRYTIYYQNNVPIFYQKDIRDCANETNCLKKIFFIDNMKNQVISLVNLKDVRDKHGESILRESLRLYEYWESDVKDFSFNQKGATTPNTR